MRAPFADVSSVAVVCALPAYARARGFVPAPATNDDALVRWALGHRALYEVQAAALAESEQWSERLRARQGSPPDGFARAASSVLPFIGVDLVRRLFAFELPNVEHPRGAAYALSSYEPEELQGFVATALMICALRARATVPDVLAAILASPAAAGPTPRAR